MVHSDTTIASMQRRGNRPRLYAMSASLLRDVGQWPTRNRSRDHLNGANARGKISPSAMRSIGPPMNLLPPHHSIASSPGRFIGVFVRCVILAALIGYSTWVLAEYVVANVHFGTVTESAAGHRP
jgi:hypothetical protein